MDFSRTHLSLRRPLTSYSKVQQLVSALIRNRPQRWEAKPLLNLGCGPFPHPAFVNVDWHWRPGVVCWDATKPLPFADRSMEGIFSEHCIEHLPFVAVSGVLRELRRVLLPGGTLRIIVPDGELYARNYTAGLPMPLGDGEMTAMFSINRIFREHGHQFIYDFETLALVLRHAGFEAEKRSFMEGRDERLLIDRAERAVESLYVDAH